MADDGLDEFNTIAGSKASSNPDDEVSSRTATRKSKGDGGALKCYAVSGKSYFPMGSTVDNLDPGVYSIGNDDNKGVFFMKKDIKLDELLILPDMNCDRVLEGIKHFWNREQKFREYGFLWKRGVLLWGAPGGGKTSLIQLLSREIVSRGGLAIYSDYPGNAVKALEKFRTIEPTRPIVVILEDIDAIIKDYGESELLSLLDGEVQIDNVVYIATTNYPEMLDKRLVNRPSRFDEVIKINMPTADARRVYLKHKVPKFNDMSSVELETWVKATDGMSVAHLRELIVSVECLGKDLNEVLKRLKMMNNAKVSSEQTEKSSLGFTAEF